MTRVLATWEVGGAAIALEGEVRAVVLRFSGSLAAPDAMQQLKAIVDDTDALAVRDSVTRVTVELRALEYASASLWKAIAYWLGVLARRPSPYELALVIDRDRTWQTIGTSMLAAFGQRLLIVNP